MALLTITQQIEAELAANVVQGFTASVPSPGATGSVTVSAPQLAAITGSYFFSLVVLSTGVPGVATAKISRNGGQRYSPPFVIPDTTGGPYSIPLEPRAELTGIDLAFAGTFTQGDSYTFSGVQSILFGLGEEANSLEQNPPRCVWVLREDDYTGTEDYSPGLDYRTQARSLATARMVIDAHLWGADHEQTLFLRDQVATALRSVVTAGGRLRKGYWNLDKSSVNRAGREYVLTFTVDTPVIEGYGLPPGFLISQPPHTYVPTAEWLNPDGTNESQTPP